MVCDHEGYCFTYCEDHWGDCNEDYRDGCEAPIENRIYCPGDPRIHQYFPPTVIFFDERKPKGPGRFDSDTFNRALQRFRPELTRCYERVLANAPKVQGSMDYLFTLGNSGRITESTLVRSEPQSSELEACVEQMIARFAVDEPPQGGFVTFAYQLEFTAGYYNTDDQ